MELKEKLCLEQLEQRITVLLSSCEYEYSEKFKVMRDLEEAS